MKQSDIKELESLLNYLQDKIDSCYEKETRIAIDDFLTKVKR
jgi:hypothetical protein